MAYFYPQVILYMEKKYTLEGHVRLLNEDWYLGGVEKPLHHVYLKPGFKKGSYLVETPDYKYIIEINMYPDNKFIPKEVSSIVALECK